MMIELQVFHPEEENRRTADYQRFRADKYWVGFAIVKKGTNGDLVPLEQFVVSTLNLSGEILENRGFHFPLELWKNSKPLAGSIRDFSFGIRDLDVAFENDNNEIEAVYFCVHSHNRTALTKIKKTATFLFYTSDNQKHELLLDHTVWNAQVLYFKFAANINNKLELQFPFSWSSIADFTGNLFNHLINESSTENFVDTRESTSSPKSQPEKLPTTLADPDADERTTRTLDESEPEPEPFNLESIPITKEYFGEFAAIFEQSYSAAKKFSQSLSKILPWESKWLKLLTFTIPLFLILIYTITTPPSKKIIDNFPQKNYIFISDRNELAKCGDLLLNTSLEPSPRDKNGEEAYSKNILDRVEIELEKISRDEIAERANINAIEKFTTKAEKIDSLLSKIATNLDTKLEHPLQNVTNDSCRKNRTAEEVFSSPTKEKIEQAIDSLATHVILNPDDSRAYINLSVLNLLLHKFDKAVDNAKMAVVYDKHNAVAWTSLAISLGKKNKKNKESAKNALCVAMRIESVNAIEEHKRDDKETLEYMHKNLARQHQKYQEFNEFETYCKKHLGIR